jgi:hypothetical protein
VQFALKGQSGRLRVSQPDAYLLLQFLVSRLVGCMEFVGYGLTHFGGLVSWWVGGVVRRAYKFGGWFSADSAGCTLGRLNHWWRSVWVSVFGEGGVSHIRGFGEHRAFGASMNENCTLWTLRVER